MKTKSRNLTRKYLYLIDIYFDFTKLYIRLYIRFIYQIYIIFIIFIRYILDLFKNFAVFII